MAVRAKSLAVLAVLVPCVNAAPAADLLEVFELAKARDPQFLEAADLRLAGLEAKPQARAALLPQLFAGGEVETRETDGSGTFLQVVDPNPGPASTRRSRSSMSTSASAPIPGAGRRACARRSSAGTSGSGSAAPTPWSRVPRWATAPRSRT